MHKQSQQKRFALHPLVVAALGILFISTIFWTYLGIRVHSTNADQLINSYLMSDQITFAHALIPGAHTFLIKWPLFVVVQLFEHSSLALALMTFLTCLLTVGAIAYILYRIEKRPMRFSILILILACVLLFIPPQPHDGGLLPVNFAMLTTRNSEYIFYIISLVLILRTKKVYSWQFLAASTVLALLVASDKLFLALSIGGAASMYVVYRLLRRQDELAGHARMWLFVSGVGWLSASLLLWAIDALAITTITGQADASPYHAVTDIRQLVLASFFAVMGILTNFGANPLFDSGVIKEMPSIVLSRIPNLATIGFIVNGTALTASCIALYKIVRHSLHRSLAAHRSRKNKPQSFTTADVLSLMLIASSLVAGVLFIATNHYYPADARYLTITFFTLIISLATYQRTLPTITKRLSYVIVGILLVAICTGGFWAHTTAHTQISALATVNTPTATIITTMKQHKVATLVGDYWRVVPIRDANRQAISTIVPLASCTTSRNTLTSTLWEERAATQKFAYLLSLDKGLANYEQCTLDHIIKEYGQPRSRVIIRGTTDKPTEMLLFYESLKTKSSSDVRPMAVPFRSNHTLACANNMTMMNIVAHQDDDLLFMNPTIANAIDRGYCIRTVYLTAGDAGQAKRYWLARENATREAYISLMNIHPAAPWIHTRIKITDDSSITTLTPKDNPRVSLLFMRLPDGNLHGNGFTHSRNESINNLLHGNMQTVRSVDEVSQYSSHDIVYTLTQLMKSYQPSVINTQAMSQVGIYTHDHSDHITTGIYTEQAYADYQKTVAHQPKIHFYVGYPVRERPENVTGDDLARKLKAFINYSRYDDSVCQSIELCAQTPTYWSYLHREYTTD
jgi:LmbE family N-acetylglucosaminyl deacetylase